MSNVNYKPEYHRTAYCFRGGVGLSLFYKRCCPQRQSSTPKASGECLMTPIEKQEGNPGGGQGSPGDLLTTAPPQTQALRYLSGA